MCQLVWNKYVIFNLIQFEPHQDGNPVETEKFHGPMRVRLIEVLLYTFLWSVRRSSTFIIGLVWTCWSSPGRLWSYNPSPGGRPTPGRRTRSDRSRCVLNDKGRRNRKSSCSRRATRGPNALCRNGWTPRKVGRLWPTCPVGRLAADLSDGNRRRRLRLRRVSTVRVRTSVPLGTPSPYSGRPSTARG